MTKKGQKNALARNHSHSPVFRCQVVPEVVVRRQLDGLLRGDQQDIYGGSPVHAKVALGSVGLPEAVEHRLVHSLAIWSDLLILQARLDQVQGKHTRHPDDARDSAVDDLGQEPGRIETKVSGAVENEVVDGNGNIFRQKRFPMRLHFTQDKGVNNRLVHLIADK